MIERDALPGRGAPDAVTAEGAVDLSRCVYPAAAIRAAERPLLEAGEPLMQYAAAALAQATEELLPATGRVLVLAGRGDNGGDALFAGAILAASHEVDVFLTSDGAHQEGLRAARRAGAGTVALDDVRSSLEYDVVLDGMIGLGATGQPLRGMARAVAQLIGTHRSEGDDSRPTVIAVDLPSGLHPDEGTADDVVLRADLTVTFGALTPGLLTGRGGELAGEVRVVDIGLGSALARTRPAARSHGAHVVVGPVAAQRA